MVLAGNPPFQPPADPEGPPSRRPAAGRSEPYNADRMRERVIELCRMRGILPIHLGELAGTARRTATKFLEGGSEAPKIDVVWAWAKALGVPVSVLVGELEINGRWLSASEHALIRQVLRDELQKVEQSRQQVEEQARILRELSANGDEPG